MPASRMPSDAAFSHADFERLVTGRSLNALEPEDDERLSSCLPVCTACQHSLALLEEMAAELGKIARTVTPPPVLWEVVIRGVGTPPTFPGRPAPPGSGAAGTSGPA